MKKEKKEFKYFQFSSRGSVQGLNAGGSDSGKAWYGHAGDFQKIPVGNFPSPFFSMLLEYRLGLYRGPCGHWPALRSHDGLGRWGVAF